MNKQGLMKAGLAGVLLVLAVFVFISVLNSSISSSENVSENYKLGESIKISLKGLDVDKIRVETPTQYFMVSGKGVLFRFTPNETGDYKVIVIGINSSKIFSFRVVDENKGEIKNENKNEVKTGIKNEDENETSKIENETTGNIKLVDNNSEVNGLKEEKGEDESKEDDGKIVINKPVKWKEKIDISENKGKGKTLMKFPVGSRNLSVFLINNSEKLKINFSLEKESALKYAVSKMFGRESEREQYVSIDNSNALGDVELEYYTDAPTASESKISELKKEVLVSSPEGLHYYNVTSYTEIPEFTADKNLIKVYWKEEDKYLDFEAFDKDGNGLLDYIEWNVEHLSSQTFEVSIQILNVQSYPPLYGNWNVDFKTIGKADLTIRAVNGTFWDTTEKEGNDLMFLEIKCGEKLLNYEWVDNGVFIKDYECNETGQETSKELSTGKHTLEFDFGGMKAYAFNDITNASLMLFYNGTTIPNDWTCVSCASGDPFIRDFREGIIPMGGKAEQQLIRIQELYNGYKMSQPS